MRIVALQSTRKSGCESSNEIRILAVGFLAASPSRITTEVGVGSTHHPASTVVFAQCVIGFIGFKRGNLFDESGVPCLSQSPRLRELRGRNHGLVFALPTAWPTKSETMQAFDVSRTYDAEPRYGRICAQGVYLFLRGHAGQQVSDALFRRQRWILERVWALCRRGLHSYTKAEERERHQMPEVQGAKRIKAKAHANPFETFRLMEWQDPIGAIISCT